MRGEVVKGIELVPKIARAGNNKEKLDHQMDTLKNLRQRAGARLFREIV